jgi:hypothetical protein
MESGTGSNVTDYVAADGRNSIAITADVADIDALTDVGVTGAQGSCADGGTRSRTTHHGVHPGGALRRAKEAPGLERSS